MPNYEAVSNKKRELIRKALKGSVFIAPVTAPAITNLTAKVGSLISLAALPTDYEDLGWLTSEGASFAREVSQSEVSSWGSNTPTRTDITADTTSLTLAAQETKLLTIGLATGADLAALTADAETGEVRIEKPDTPDARSYRALSVAVDSYQGQEIYIARFLPSAKVTNYAEQAFGGGDDPVTWGVTLTAEKDSTLGFTEAWLFGGPGWNAQLAAMGIETS